MTKTRWLIVLAAVLLAVALVGFAIASQEAPPKTLWPTKAELTQPGRVNRLVGTWVFLGSFMMADDSFASGGPVTCTFRADGRCSYQGANRWEVDPEGRLHLWASSAPSEASWPEFFFRNGKLYLMGDSQWEVYRRQ